MNKTTTHKDSLDICAGSPLEDHELARISHTIERIGAPNQRKFFCEKHFR